MYLSKVELHNIRMFEELTIDFKKNNKFILWTTILGNNAVGKSTILKCIAMGLCDEASAAALMKESNAEFLRKGKLDGYIKLTLYDINQKKVEIQTKFEKDSIDQPERVRQVILPNDKPWNNLFFCGYGASIAGGGGEGFEKYKPLEAVYTLFNYRSELQNPEVLMLRQEPSLRDWLGNKLLNILMLDEYKIKYSRNGMYFTNPQGEFRIDELSDGYRMMSLKIFEFFGWAILAENFKKAGDEMSGILLIDELETHLHPKWQRNVVSRLRKQLSKVQIIITSHSPIIALGTADLEDALMVELEFDSMVENVARDKEVEAGDYKGLTVDQILTSSPFNLPIARSGETGDKILRFQELLLKKSLSKNEQDEFDALKAIIRELPDVYETMENLRIHNEIKELLAKDIHDSNKK